ncbi:MAG TPA: multidrug efflux SMR transporter [Pirellulales bacterium]|jgi:quaternary ammonium compound-resistance protein SugE
MAWVYLMIAGLIESAWAIGLKFTDGFTRLWPSVFTIGGIVASMFLLSVAARAIPIGTAYAVWVGIGTAGTVIAEIMFLGGSSSPARLFFLCMLVTAIIGLKVTSH